MLKIEIVVTHRKTEHAVVIDLPENLAEAVKTMGEEKVFMLFVTQLKTKLAGEAWADFEREAKGDVAGRTAGWQKQLFKK